VQASFSDLTEIIRERFAGIRLIKAHNRKAVEAARVEAASRAYVNENLKLVRITGAFFPMMLLFTNLSMRWSFWSAPADDPARHHAGGFRGVHTATSAASPGR